MDNDGINQETSTPLLGNMLGSRIKFTLDILSINRLSFQLASNLEIDGTSKGKKKKERIFP